MSAALSSLSTLPAAAPAGPTSQLSMSSCQQGLLAPAASLSLQHPAVSLAPQLTPARATRAPTLICRTNCSRHRPFHSCRLQRTASPLRLQAASCPAVPLGPCQLCHLRAPPWDQPWQAQF